MTEEGTTYLLMLAAPGLFILAVAAVWAAVNKFLDRDEIDP